MEGERGDKLGIPRSRAGNRPHTQNCIAGLFNSKPWKVMAHCWVADALSKWEGLTCGSQRQQVTTGCWAVGHYCRESGRTGASLMSTGAWWAEDTLVSKWLGCKVTSVPRADSSHQVDSVFLEPGSPGPTWGVREQIRGSTECQDPREQSHHSPSIFSPSSASQLG